MTSKLIRDVFGENAQVTAEMGGLVLSVGEDSFWIRSEIKGREIEAQFSVSIVDEKDRALLKEGVYVVLRTIDPGDGRDTQVAVSFITEKWTEDEIEEAKRVAKRIAGELGWNAGGVRP